MSPDVASELVTLFKRAESQIKTLELLYEDVGLYFHPVNQLRYAGYHIVRAIESSEGGKEKEEQCNRAKRHCQRAIYDASEMAIVYCLSEIDNFQQDYKNMDIAPTVDNYLDIKQVAREAQDLIKTTDHTKREEKYEECDALFGPLKSHVDRLNDARPELNKRLTHRRNSLLFTLIFIALGVVGIFVSLATSS